jgi:hypothetical protein
MSAGGFLPGGDTRTFGCFGDAVHRTDPAHPPYTRRIGIKVLVNSSFRGAKRGATTQGPCRPGNLRFPEPALGPREAFAEGSESGVYLAGRLLRLGQAAHDGAQAEVARQVRDEAAKA